MTHEERLSQLEWLKDVFPNYKDEMYWGNMPQNTKPGLNGEIYHYNPYYGSGDMDDEGNLLNAQIGLDTNNTLYIIGNNIHFLHIPVDGIPHYWCWNNSTMWPEGEGFQEHGKSCLPKYPKDYIQKMLKKKRDFDGSLLWEKAKERFREEFVKREGEFI